MNFYQRFAVNANAVGDWEGEEELAANQVNRIYRELSEAMPTNVDPRIAQRMFERVWSDWSVDMRLLDVNETEIRSYTRQLIQASL